MSTGVELACFAMADVVPKKWGVARGRLFFPRDALRSLLLWPCACKVHETGARGRQRAHPAGVLAPQRAEPSAAAGSAGSSMAFVSSMRMQ